jgi:outer membrane murein-binding lipoprotein Lpp
MPEQIEWLVFQVALLVAKVNRLESDSEALVLALKAAENRLAAVERATPLTKPKSPPPKRRPWDRGI